MTSIIDTLEIEGHAGLTAAQHGAAWLVGELAKGETALSSLEANSPWIASAVQAGIAAANAHGVPVATLEGIGEEVLALAKELAAGLSAPAPGVPATPSPAAA